MQFAFNSEMILDSLEQNIFVKDVNYKYLFANSSYARLIGEEPSKIIGKSDFDYFPKDIAQKYRQDDSTILKNKEAVDIVENITINNEMRTVRTVKKPLYSEDKVIGLVGVFSDINKEKEEEFKYKKLQYNFIQAQALANIGHWDLNLVENRLYWSDEVYRIFGLKPQEFGATYEAFLEHVYPSDIDFVKKSYRDSVENKKKYQITHRIVRKNGEIGFVEERCEHDFDTNGNIIRSFGTIHDVTEQKKAKSEIVLASKVFSNMSDGVLITDAKQKILKRNKSFTRISGYSEDEIIGKTPNFISSGWHDKEFYKAMWHDINTKGQWSGEITDRKKNGELYIAELTIMALYDSDKTLTNYISITNDISEKKQQEKRIHNLAYFDSVTALPNRVLFEKHVVSKMPTSIRENKKLAIIFIDLDNFKNVNDTLGHFIGDKFLVEVAKAIKDIIREKDILARLGGDEYTIILEDIKSAVNVVPVVQKIIKRFKEPIIVEDKELFSGASIGISIYPDDGKTYEELIKAADTAMYQVKESGKNSYQFYDESMNEKITERMLIENDLRSAISKNEFFLEYQPKVYLDTKSVYGMEALIRWNHSAFGLINPDKFIGVSEDTGQIYEIGLWAVKQAVSDTKKLHEEGSMLTVSINVSNKQLENEAFIEDISTITDEIGLDKSYIELEITESHIMKNVDKTLFLLNELHKKGFKLSIDDFGTGYSSLSYIKKLPAKTIKIDRSFVLDIEKNEEDRSIVAAIIAMAKSLGKAVIAEGSETQGHIDTLQALNCNQIQGYYFSKPLPLAKFREFICNFKGECKPI